MSIQAVRAQIRFALEQLKLQNKHHEFEHIAREYTRQRICRNLLPATGPVGGGGDQGRDFETYKTYLDDSLSTESTGVFEGVSKTGNVFFACSLKKEIVPKIRSDLRSIFSKTDERRPVTYFCVEEISVGKRNNLIGECLKEHGTELQILDGQALSENLSDPDVFWIAVEFLHIPSDLYPELPDIDESYSEYKERWITEGTQPHNFSDFCQIKYGLRRATFNEKLKPDLPAWITCINRLLERGDSYMRRRAQYEICVAALRGQNNLSAYADTVREYFLNIEVISNPTDLTDVGVLLNYCSTAKIHGQFDIESSFLHQTSKRFVACVDQFLDKIEGPNTRCILLDIRARSSLLQFLDSETPTSNFDGAFEYWNEVVELIESAPLFPLEQFSDILSILTPIVGEDERFLKLTNRLDELLASRFGGFKAAEKCRDRAVAFYEQGNIVQAIDHLHKAKINWFAAETLRGTIMTSRFLGECYVQLGLVYAGRYYLFSSCFLALHSPDDEDKELASGCLFQAASTFYQSGDWLTFFGTMQMALKVHHLFDDELLNVGEHEELANAFICAAIIRTLSNRFWAAADESIENKFLDWPLDDQTRRELESLTTELPKESYWMTAALEEIWRHIERDLAGRPFSDLGASKNIRWKALGIKWEVEFPNDFETALSAEEFVAVLQVILADFARNDLQLLPTSVQISLFSSAGSRFEITENFSNDQLSWTVGIPSPSHTIPAASDERTDSIFSLAISILGFCTTMSIKEYRNGIESALRKGLFGKAFFARPYPEIFEDIVGRDLFYEDEKANLGQVELTRSFEPTEHEDLVWSGSQGANYAEAEALVHATKRYSRTSSLMKVIWPKILASTEHREFFQEMKDSGFRDWHLTLVACNTVAGHLANKKLWRGHSDEKYMQALNQLTLSIIDGNLNNEIEQLSISEINIEEFKIQEKISLAAMMSTWGLSVHTPTPDFEAIRQFLIERYRILETDAPHEALFQ